MEIKEMIEARKKQALEEKIEEKAEIIAKNLGSDYHSEIHVCRGGGLAGDGFALFKRGYIYENDSLKIESLLNQDNIKEISIYFLTKKIEPFLYFFKKTKNQSEIVYSQENSEIKLFKKENEWLANLNKIYEKANEFRDKTAWLNDIADREERSRKIQELARDFGLR